jgi:hypothetical protein
MGRMEKSRSLDLGQKGQLGNKLGGTSSSLLQGNESCILQVHNRGLYRMETISLKTFAITTFFD